SGSSGTGVNGTFQSGSRFSALTLSAGAFLNLNNNDATFGSLSGAGTVMNVAATGATAVKTLNVGFDNTSTTFSGSFARFTDSFTNPIVVNKVGTGTMTLTGNTSTDTNTLQVSQGGLTFSGTGTG